MRAQLEPHPSLPVTVLGEIPHSAVNFSLAQMCADPAIATSVTVTNTEENAGSDNGRARIAAVVEPLDTSFTRAGLSSDSLVQVHTTNRELDSLESPTDLPIDVQVQLSQITAASQQRIAEVNQLFAQVGYSGLFFSANLFCNCIINHILILCQRCIRNTWLTWGFSYIFGLYNHSP